MAFFEISCTGEVPGDFDPARVNGGGHPGARWKVTFQSANRIEVQAADPISAFRLGWDVIWLERNSDDRWIYRAYSQSRLFLLILAVLFPTLVVLTVLSVGPFDELRKILSAIPHISPVAAIAALGGVLLGVDLLAVLQIQRRMADQGVRIWLRQITGNGGA
ncbi:MAG TPA: hypothetical protein PLO53_01030 [Candidatus Hydrogenedentes bacterium]|mgnify:FL=1|nr:hypothetical protein [Candidatus Hydrogenedentota bacterium]